MRYFIEVHTHTPRLLNIARYFSHDLGMLSLLNFRKRLTRVATGDKQLPQNNSVGRVYLGKGGYTSWFFSNKYQSINRSVGQSINIESLGNMGFTTISLSSNVKNSLGVRHIFFMQ